jgi:uncharacterized protein (DUF427 family)
LLTLIAAIDADSIIITLGSAECFPEISTSKDKTMKATWDGAVIAESDDTIVIEGNHYFPPDAVKRELLTASDTHTTCPWKGIASYYNVMVKDKVNKDAAWFYPEPKEAAKEIAGYVAFWKGVEVAK